jgi:hypothetical protein
MTLCGFGNSFSGGAVVGLLVLYTVQALGLAADAGRIGVPFTAGAAGSLLTALLPPRLVRRVATGRVTLYGLIATPLLIGALAPGFVVGCTLYVVWSAASS